MPGLVILPVIRCGGDGDSDSDARRAQLRLIN